MPDTENTQERQENSKEFAIAEFNRLAEVRDLDIDTEDMDAEDLSDFNKIKKKIVAAIASQTIAIDGDGQVEVTMRKSTVVSSVTFKIRDGGMMMAMDKFKRSQDNHKTYGLMASMTGTAPSTFAKMVDPDLGLCEKVMLLLMG